MEKVIRHHDKEFAVIEVGSRAVRLLIASVSEELQMRQIDTQVRNTKIIEALKTSELALAAELALLVRSIDELTRYAKSRGVADIVVFGTEAVRSLAESGLYRKSGLAERIGYVLSEKLEALCSFVAGGITLSNMGINTGDWIVLDHGSGSLEVALGSATGGYSLQWSESWPLGGSHLLGTFHSCGRDLNRLRALILLELGEMDKNWGNPAPFVIMGTVATKCAWLTKRRSVDDRYDPKRVEGVQLSRSGLQQIFDYANSLNQKKDVPKAWERFQEFVNPGEAGGDAAERVASGIVPLIELLTLAKSEKFVVSALGSRHGFAMLLACCPENLVVGSADK